MRFAEVGKGSAGLQFRLAKEAAGASAACDFALPEGRKAPRQPAILPANGLIATVAWSGEMGSGGAGGWLQAAPISLLVSAVAFGLLRSSFGSEPPATAAFRHASAINSRCAESKTHEKAYYKA